MFAHRIVLSIVIVVQGVSSDSGGRIVGGEKTTIDRYPYQVSLQIKNQHFCGGSVISAEWIVTAAHCVNGMYLPIFVKLGLSNLKEIGTVIPVKSIIVHEKYNRRNSDFDIALIRLSTLLSFNDKTKAVSLPSQRDMFTNGSLATVTGWGNLKSVGTRTKQLYKVEVPLVSYMECKLLYRGLLISQRMICAGFVDRGGKDACQGDSGGPLVLDGKLIGIVSWGLGCAEANYPGVYTRVTALRSWIREKTGL